MNVTKAACILVASICYDYCWTPTKYTYTVSDNKGDKLSPEAPWLNPLVTVLLFRVVVAPASILYLALMICGSSISDDKAVQQLNEINTWHWIAIVISLMGVVLRKWAFMTLDRFFTYQLAIRSEHKLVQTGPYRYLRHPSYTGGLITTLFLQIVLWHQGLYDIIALFLNSKFALEGFSNINFIIPATYFGIGGGIWIAVILTSLITTRIMLRVWAEEIMLREHFKEEWTVYASQRWRLLPLVY